MFFRKPNIEALWKPEYDALSRYNAEKHRGISHTPEWIEKMAALQNEYDKQIQKQYSR